MGNSGLMKSKGKEADEVDELALPDVLALAIRCLPNPSENQTRLLEILAHLQLRLATERFQLAVLGQFKRGKSTLLNALLRAEVLPVGVIPVTAIPTFLESGGTPLVCVTYSSKRVDEFNVDGWDALRERLTTFVTEEYNPGNKLGIARVDVRMSSPSLEHGVVLIDTPGVGSTFRHNSAAADAVLPECDATLFVVSADPPITEVELEFLARIRQTTARIIVVLNKIDVLEPQEREKALTFLRRVLAEQGKFDASPPIFCLSARKALRAAKTGDVKGFEASGIAELEAYLTRFLAMEKRATLERAVARKASRLVAELRLEAEITVRALHLPINDLERRIATFDEASSRFETERRSARDLLAGDRVRAIREMEMTAERLRNEARTVLQQALDQALAKDADPQAVREMLAPVIVSFFSDALQKTVHWIGEQLNTIFRVHQCRADELVTLVRQTAAELMEIPLHSSASAEAFVPRRDPFWLTNPASVTINPVPPDAMDRLFPVSVRRKRVHSRLLKEIETVVIRNVENLRWATLQNLEDAFRRFGSELDERLEASLVATRGAMNVALNRRTQHSEAIATAIADGQTASSRLLAIERRLGSYAESDGSSLWAA
jgi:GTPase Era involved in 16S rRNA processing